MFATDKESARDRLLAQLKNCGAILNGHFVFGEHTRGERHGRIFVNPRAIYRNYVDSIGLVQALQDAIPKLVRDSIEVVAGPATGGAVLARDMSMLISNERPLTAPALTTIFFTKDDGAYTLSPSDEAHVAGKLVLLVDDVRHVNRTLMLCSMPIQHAGGRVAATASIVDRSYPYPMGILGGPAHYSAVHIPDDPLYIPTMCPMCSAREPITRF